MRHNNNECQLALECLGESLCWRRLLAISIAFRAALHTATRQDAFNFAQSGPHLGTVYTLESALYKYFYIIVQNSDMMLYEFFST